MDAIRRAKGRRDAAAAAKRAGLAIVAALALGPVAARDESRPGAAAIGDVVESCVSDAKLAFAPEQRRAVVDDADTAALGEAFLSRYPAFAQTSPPPQKVILWNKPGSGWVYVALLANPGKPGDLCFTATFAAERFAATPRLLKKYFGIEST